MILNTKDFTTTGTYTPGAVKFNYVAEISDLNLRSAPREFTLQDCPAPGQQRSFSYSKVDTEEGDVMGWWYEEVAGPNKGYPAIRVLIIND